MMTNCICDFNELGNFDQYFEALDRFLTFNLSLPNNLEQIKEIFDMGFNSENKN